MLKSLSPTRMRNASPSALDDDVDCNVDVNNDDDESTDDDDDDDSGAGIDDGEVLELSDVGEAAASTDDDDDDDVIDGACDVDRTTL